MTGCEKMEFLKHNWGYLLLIAVVLITAAVVWYLLFLAGNQNPYAGGLLVDLNGWRLTDICNQKPCAEGLLVQAAYGIKEMWV